jgi:hypothetical protein
VVVKIYIKELGSVIEHLPSMQEALDLTSSTISFPTSLKKRYVSKEK